MWPHTYGQRSPCWRGLKGKGVFLPLEDSPGMRARVATRRSGQLGGRPSHQARARARPDEHAPAVWRKRCEGDKVRETDKAAPPVIEKKTKTHRWA
jgi:hypothetical protein